MRIIAGRWEGRQLTSPVGRIRPTGEALRDFWMSLLEEDLPRANVLDLFAGTGALGLEALSRGAAKCDFVENAGEALHALKANVVALGAKGKTRVFDRDAIPFVEALTGMPYDIALADPPYGSKKLDRVVARWTEAPFSRVLVLEHDPEHALPVKGKRFPRGDSMLTVLRARNPPPDRRTGSRGRMDPRGA